MKKVLLFPGAFNPPHKGHMALVQAAVNHVPLDEVWIMPSGRRDDGKVISINYQHRRNLSTLFVKSLQELINIPVTLITIELDDAEGTIGTHEYINRVKTISDVEAVQLIGSDAYESLLQNNLIIDSEKFLVFKRPGHEITYSLREGDQSFNFELPHISSTMVRTIVKEGNEEYRALVTEEVADYIEVNNLYK